MSAKREMVICVFVFLGFFIHSVCLAELRSARGVQTKVASGISPLNLRVERGVRSSDLNWSIGYDSGSGAGPNILSELDYNKLDVSETTIGLDYAFPFKEPSYGFRYVRPRYWVISAEHRWADIDSGISQDSDYYFSNRQGEFSRSLSDVAGDDVNYTHLRLGLRQAILVKQKHYVGDMTLFFGGVLAQQHLRVQNGVQVISRDENLNDVESALGPFDGLNTTYRVDWRGFTVGAGFSSAFSKLVFDGELRLYALNYEAQANWNLREDFANPLSFLHRSDGRGYAVDIRLAYQWQSSWQLYCAFNYEFWRVTEGTDITYFADGTTEDLPFKSAEWASTAYRVGVQWQWR